MNNDELYSMLVCQKPDKLVLEFENKNFEKLSNYEIMIYALACLIKGWIDRGEKIFSKISNTEKFSNKEKSFYLETKMVLLASKTKDYSEPINLAYQALELNENAIFAKSFIGQIYFKGRRITDAVELYHSILDKYPDADWAYYRLSSYLTMLGEYRNALTYIPKIKSISLRCIYWLLAKLFLPLRIIWIIGIGMLMSFKTTFIYFFIFFSIFCLTCIFVGLNKKDKYIMNFFIFIEFFALFFLKSNIN